MVLDALETGVLRGDGPYYPRPETPIRPRPSRSFADRLFSVAMSPDSVLQAADLGAQMIVFSQRPWEDQAAAYGTYRDRFEARHHAEPKPLLTCDFVYCDRDPVRARDKAEEHKIGRASCRERVCQYVLISGADVYLKKKKKNET